MSDRSGTPETTTAATADAAAAADTAPRPAGGRLLWADCAKGLSIIGVCYMHVVTGVPGATDTAWNWFNGFMDPIRMPLFFVISGLFAHRVIERTLGDLWYRRLWFLLVPYLVFTPVQAAIRLDMADDLSWTSLGRAILLGDPGIWFLYVLMIFNILACLLRHLPPVWSVAVSFIPALVVAAAGLSSIPEITHITQYAPAFFVGLHFRQLFLRLAAHAGNLAVIATVFVVFLGWEWIFSAVADHVRPGGWSTGEASLMGLLAMVRIFTAVPAGILVATWLSRTPVVAGVLSAIGRNTLPIYVSHHAALHLVMAVVVPSLLANDPETWGFLAGTNAMVYTGLLTCAVAGFVFYLVGRTPVLKWVLHPPALPRRTSRRTREAARENVAV
ncbi:MULTISPECIES: acyltransferase family protein [unclassified Corynebacterium]|uniref:acyltransferase family protein n=1 Tax=unclassified Corynebacterium TaxID=2624378 RepID=UPI002656569E|nr:acyltransferase family protein [Corynebacterium sp.]MDN6324158.1 acyltransferase family protein [Corynebacterium sp.]MDN6509434.1 acyltransferase family protein [Corynebacterium sp.]